MQVSRITSRFHPDYANMETKWRFWLDSYEATLDEYALKYLFRNEKEGSDEFRSRRERAYRENHTKRVVDLVNSYLFKEPPTRRTENKQVESFLKSVDGRGTDMNQFMKTVSVYAALLGRTYVVVDKTPVPAPTGTHLDNLEAEVYCYMVLPQDVTDIAFDDRGQVKWAVVREVSRDDDDPFTSTGDFEYRYRLWQRGEWTLFSEEGDVIESGDTGFDTVPIIPVDNERSNKRYHGLSLVQDIAYLDRAIFNNWSKLDVVVTDQTFSQLIMPIEASVLGNAIQDEELREQYLQLSTKRVLLYSAQAESKPEFISPDASQAEFILKMLITQTKQLYASLGLQNEADSEVTAQSGQAKAYDFDKLNNMLASKADNLEQAEISIIEMFKGWKGITDESFSIDYPDDFDTKSLQQEILLAQELALLDISEAFQKEVHKRVAMKALPKMPEKLLETIIKEIDEKPINDPDALNDAQMDFDAQNDDNNGNDNFADKRAKGKKGGRLRQDQSKAEQM